VWLCAKVFRLSLPRTHYKFMESAFFDLEFGSIKCLRIAEALKTPEGE
jgi:hypothetical protein